MLEVGESLDINMVMAVLPHRYPMLMIDRITQIVPMQRATGYKNLSINEPFFQGHFPGRPMMPGVLMIEALAQLGGTIILRPDDISRRTAVLTGIDKAKFRRPVIPGDRLDMETKVLRVRSAMGWITAEAKVAGKLVCTAELMFAIANYAYFGMDAAILHE